MQLLTVSEIRTYRRCPREHHIRYGLGYRSIGRALSLRFGSLSHCGLEAWWKAHQDARWPEMESAICRAATDPKCTVDLFEFEKAREMLLAYHARWVNEELETVTTEQQFECPLINPETGYPSKTFMVGGKIDVIVRDSEGRLWLVEHKTSASDITAGSDYWKLLQLDNQVSMYFTGARAIGYEVSGCLYDVLGKPAFRPSQIPVLDSEGIKVVHDATGVRVRAKDGKKWRETGDTASGYVLQTRPETPEEYGARIRAALAADPSRYFVRGTVVRLAQEEQDAAWDAWTTAKQIHTGNRARQWPRNPDACVRYRRTCDYFGYCTGTECLEDETKFVRLEDPHEELTRPVAA